MFWFNQLRRWRNTSRCFSACIIHLTLKGFKNKASLSLSLFRFLSSHSCFLFHNLKQASPGNTCEWGERRGTQLLSCFYIPLTHAYKNMPRSFTIEGIFKENQSLLKGDWAPQWTAIVLYMLKLMSLPVAQVYLCSFDHQSAWYKMRGQLVTTHVFIMRIVCWHRLDAWRPLRWKP